MKNACATWKHVAITKRGFPRPKDGIEQFELWIIDLGRLFSVGFFNSDEQLSAVRVAQLKRTALPTFDVKTLGGGNPAIPTIIKMPKLAASGTTALCLANVPQQTPESHARPFRR
jgi:hypothetical protein